MSLTVKAKAVKEISNNQYGRIIACEPIGKFDGIKLSRYFNFTIKGNNIPFITVGKEYTLEIEENQVDNFGISYRVVSVPSMKEQDFRNLSDAETMEILMECTSSERIAKSILEAYPNYIQKVLTEGEESIDVDKIKGVGVKFNRAYCRILNEKYKYFHILQKYSKYKIDLSDCKLLVDKYKDDERLEKGMTDYPYYVLTEILSRGFEKADKLILENRPELKESDQRVEALIIHVLRLNELTGSTKLTGSKLFEYVNTKLNVPYLIPKLRDVSIKSDYIYYDEETNDMSVLNTYLAEVKISEFVKGKLKSGRKLNIDWKKYQKVDDFEMTDMQLNCLKNLCEYDISILAGFSGTGKSASIKNLVRMIEDNNITYMLLSSTGKASKVLSDSVGGKPSSTIHKACYSGDINVDVIVIDEFGMCALDTFIMLLDKITNPNCKIVVVGDSAQLASIGLSKIFDDFISSNIIPITMLTEVFRYKSNGSLFVATNIRNGISFFNNKEMVKYNNGVYKIGSNYKFIETEDEDILDTVMVEYRKLLNKGIKKQDIVILSPFNVKSTGTYSINKTIQAEVNPKKPNETILTRKIGTEEITFRINDLVINTKNDYKSISADSYELMKSNKNELREEDVCDSVVINGQIGVIRNIMEDGMIVQYDEELIYVSKQKLNNILLAYSISIHKIQGSSIPHTIEIVSKQHEKMLSRGLIYVGTTRCRESHVDIGSIDAFENALRVVENDLRRTWLKELLING